MLDIFADAQDGGTVDANELQDLNKIIGERRDRVSNSTPFTMKDSTWYLSKKVVEGVKTNSITTAIDKWFKGTVRPPASFTETDNTGKVLRTASLQYAPLQGTLYRSDEKARIGDIDQGVFGDCTPLAILGATFGSQTSDADNGVSSVIQNMIEDNLDGTYTIRFYNEISLTPEYVTVDNQVVTFTSNAASVYNQPSGVVGLLFGAAADEEYRPNNLNNNPIWVPLVEKAYAQWYQDSKGVANGYDGIGNRASLNEVFPRITGLPVNGSLVSSTPFDQIQLALNNGKFVAVGSNNEAEKNSSSLISGSSEGTHAYSVTKADNASGEQRITIRNPWGVDGLIIDRNTNQRETKDDVQDGFINLSYDEFTSYFNNVVITV
jgi:hypothetical protein